MVINPCFAKTMEINKIYVDLENYLIANRNNMNCFADLFYYQYKFFDTYSYPAGWGRKIIADVGKTIAESEEITPMSNTEEREVAYRFKTTYSNVFKLQYQQALQNPNFSVKLPREAMDAGLNNALTKNF